MGTRTSTIPRRPVQCVLTHVGGSHEALMLRESKRTRCVGIRVENSYAVRTYINQQYVQRTCYNNRYGVGSRTTLLTAITTDVRPR